MNRKKINYFHFNENRIRRKMMRKWAWKKILSLLLYIKLKKGVKLVNIGSFTVKLSNIIYQKESKNFWWTLQMYSVHEKEN